MIKSKKGSAIALALIFATVLLMMGLAYAKLTSNNKKQTVLVDERVKLQYLAHSLTELALLKFQLYPADFYACSEATKASTKVTKYLEEYTTKAPEFEKFKDSISKSSYFDKPIELSLQNMVILTNRKWRDEVLYIRSTATYDDMIKKQQKTVSRLVYLNRTTIAPGS